MPRIILRVLLPILILLTSKAFALPIDWHGVFGVDSTLIDSYRRVKSVTDNSSSGNAGDGGTQEVPLASGNHANASWQSYIFRLNPVMIINDSATLKGEITSGYGRGGRLGDNSTQSQEAGFGNALYVQNTSDENDSVIINKVYAELYSDTATWVIGRHSSEWGLGVIQNAGNDTWDRHTFVRDGVTMKIKLGNFHIQPFWAKINSNGSLTRATKVKEYGISLLYDNPERDMSFGILFSKKQNGAFDGQQLTGINSAQPVGAASATTTAIGRTDVKLTDIYFRKAFGDLEIAFEVPILSGDLGFLYGNLTTPTKYKAKAIIFESKYKASESWTIGFDAGKVSGDAGGTSSFDAMYLNPNYQIANLLFRYNTRAVSNPNDPNAVNGKSVYDSYITNTMYARFGVKYTAEKWTWNTGFIWARAEETAKTGATAFNHQSNKAFDAVKAQSDDLGYEVDFGFEYQWNKEIQVGASLGYLFAGDYWSFTNDPNVTNSTQNSYAAQIRTSIDF
ncbi:MAG: hypothetical protein HN509_11650 [Halobacteriovoraceae bacterium]|nr:hypothetical protein [Halobacteriovoraceae bacterium]MBT5095800.1 hypothetical protein [Halobacteriovoraceae bacterium]